jgi:hypothetical protein
MIPSPDHTSTSARVHASLIAFGHQVPIADLFGVAGRRLLAELDFPGPTASCWSGSQRLTDANAQTKTGDPFITSSADPLSQNEGLLSGLPLRGPPGSPSEIHRVCGVLTSPRGVARPGARALGLVGGGRVERDEFMALMRGRSPVDGAVLREMGQRSTVSGFDLTWSAPKSVSVLFAIGDEDISRALLAAHERAVDEALAYMERETCWTRRVATGQPARRRRVHRRVLSAPHVEGGRSATAHARGGGEHDPREWWVHGTGRPVVVPAQVGGRGCRSSRSRVAQPRGWDPLSDLLLQLVVGPESGLVVAA